MGMEVGELNRIVEHGEEEDAEERKLQAEYLLKTCKPTKRNGLTAIMTEEGATFRDAELPVEEPVYEKVLEWLKKDAEVQAKSLREDPDPSMTRWATGEKEPGEPEVSEQQLYEQLFAMAQASVITPPKVAHREPDLVHDDRAFAKVRDQQMNAFEGRTIFRNSRPSNPQRGRPDFPPMMRGGKL